MIFAMIFAMLLSTTSARTLKADPVAQAWCITDYQPPNYWGKCVDGFYKNADRGLSGHKTSCQALIIHVPKDVVCNETLTLKTDVIHGYIARDLFLNEYGYSLIVEQSFFFGPNVTITFYLGGKEVHKGNYQQNICIAWAGTINTDDSEALIYEGSNREELSGHVIVPIQKQLLIFSKKKKK